MIEGALITGGVCLSYWLDFGFSFLEPSSISWRFPIAFQIVFALIILAFILELPESPRWLILKGKEDEALSVLGALSDLPYDDPYIHAEFTAIKDTVLEMQQGGFRDLFTMDENRHFHRTVLAYVNQVFQQISGINLITYVSSSSDLSIKCDFNISYLERDSKTNNSLIYSMLQRSTRIRLGCLGSRLESLLLPTVPSTSLHPGLLSGVSRNTDAVH